MDHTAAPTCWYLGLLLSFHIFEWLHQLQACFQTVNPGPEKTAIHGKGHTFPTAPSGKTGESTPSQERRGLVPWNLTTITAWISAYYNAKTFICRPPLNGAQSVWRSSADDVYLVVLAVKAIHLKYSSFNQICCRAQNSHYRCFNSQMQWYADSKACKSHTAGYMSMSLNHWASITLLLKFQCASQT